MVLTGKNEIYGADTNVIKSSRLSVNELKVQESVPFSSFYLHLGNSNWGASESSE